MPAFHRARVFPCEERGHEACVGARQSLGGDRCQILSCKAMFSQLKTRFRRLVRLFFP